jgi:8-oxo-dGTP pyrophosphatase MutT (NUDIX family)
MGAGILPTTIHNNKLYFLFGKENKFEQSAPGFSDFGGGTDNKETFFQTAVREAGEELTGFLGDDKDVIRLLKKYGTYNIDYKANDGHKPYRMHIFPYDFDPLLPFYYNNNQRFLQKRLDPEVIKNSRIFEKAEIRWICVDDIIKMRSQFRHYFRNIVDMIYAQKTSIRKFMDKSVHKNNKTIRKVNKNRKTRRQKH